MSVDLSDPPIGLTRSKIQDPTEPTTWFLLHYANSATSPTPLPSTSSQKLTLLASGPEPVLPSWQEHLADTNEDILFGYGEIGGKGLVLLFLRDNVGGVKRARAVVHSRAVANLFPDYSALITIAHASQLTEDLITERLALYNHSSSSSSTVPAPTHNQPKYTIPGSDHPNPLSPMAPGGPMPYLPSSASSTSNGIRQQQSSRSVSAQYSSPSKHQNGQYNPSPNRHKTLDEVGAGTDSPSRRVGSSPSHSRVVSAGHTPQRTSSPGPILAAPISLDSPTRPKQLSLSQGISSADYFKDDPTSSRSRKTSFGARLKSTFSGRSPSSTDEPSTPASGNEKVTQPNSPTSPGTSRFKASSLAKAFHRRRSSQQADGTPSGSPKIDEHGQLGDFEYAPPVPPKDSEPSGSKDLYTQPRLPLTSAQNSDSLAGTPGHEEPAPPPISQLPVSVAATDGQAQLATLSPSPSARQALFDARQKSLTHETEIQDRFRRDQEEKHRQLEGGKNREAEDDDRSIRLAYDESEDEDASRAVPNGDNRDEIHHRQEQEEPTRSHAAEPMEGQFDDEVTPTIANDGTVPDAAAEQLSQAAEEHAQREAAIRADEERVRHLAAAEAAAAADRERIQAERLEAERRVEEERQLEEERIRLERLRFEEEARKAEEERLRVEAEEAALRQQEEERLQAEEEAKARIEAEEQARTEAEEAERIRVLQEEEKARREAEERERLEKEEAERRRVEEERKRKDGLREGLIKGKESGGVMLRGWVTVQTYKSMTWRRRYFHLLPKEMQLYKAEGDAKPIQTIFFGPATTVAERYDESQVKDSFKVISDGPKGEEEFFLFTDSSDDKETVLEGLRLCLQ
ncbi:hypothetical protein I316_07203 [Kwoniella heveanensis BCC8398]|uniref:PH domain-containing protein n=1 Tax=Kwoniella heveanensis BCC8398 TaxID=1296120 RepID=A0A1B9GJG2_9TREE|nr:hypothetical protein I316_07203 [Kwoniella heveanensis BCC8398]